MGALERTPRWLICVPLVLQWLALGLRYRSLTLPTAANPAITAGGLVGEGKLEYFAGMGPVARAATAPHCALVVTGAPSGPHLQAVVDGAGLRFPIIAKPDLGLCGYGVRRVDDLAALQHYVAAFPPGECIVLQQYLGQDGEAGIFYARDPATGAGRLIGLALRESPRVQGDGVSTVEQLIAADPRARRCVAVTRHEPFAATSRVPAAGEVVRLANIGSTRVGGRYLDGAALITPALTAAVDAVARDMPDFHFGRFDVRFDSQADLARGVFTIMEINGAGSEAIQAWDPRIGLLAGLRIVFAKQRMLFAIAHARRRAGVRPLKLLELARLQLRQQRLIDRYPPSN